MIEPNVRMIEPNGIARVERKKHWRGNETVVYDIAARITAKRITTIHGDVFDRATGRRVSAFNPHVKQRVAIAYQLDGGAWIRTEQARGGSQREKRSTATLRRGQRG
jgi:hypothetical protein